MNFIKSLNLISEEHKYILNVICYFLKMMFTQVIKINMIKNVINCLD